MCRWIRGLWEQRARREESRFYLETLRPGVVVGGKKGGGMLGEVLREIGVEGGIRIALKEPDMDEWEELGRMMSSVKKEEVIDEPPETGPGDPSRVAEILFTSGTSTGKPKGCPVTVSSTLR